MFKEFKKIIEEYNSIVIYRHQMPDGDAFGSQFGLKEIILENYPEKLVYAAGKDSNYLNKKLFPTPDDITLEIIKKSLVIVVDTANIERIDGNIEHAKYLIKIDHHPNNDKYGNLIIVDKLFASCSELITTIANDLNFKINQLAAKYLYTGMITDTGRFMYSSVTENSMIMAGLLIGTNFKPQQIYDELYVRP
jgi:phosphoesterase RecJ-like protein